jgi:hypothetical protein
MHLIAEFPISQLRLLFVLGSDLERFYMNIQVCRKLRVIAAFGAARHVAMPRRTHETQTLGYIRICGDYLGAMENYRRRFTGRGSTAEALS